ncbi:unnamed protein product [Rhodiola kirilowii]
MWMWLVRIRIFVAIVVARSFHEFLEIYTCHQKRNSGPLTFEPSPSQKIAIWPSQLSSSTRSCSSRFLFIFHRDDCSGDFTWGLAIRLFLRSSPSPKPPSEDIESVATFVLLICTDSRWDMAE